VPHIVRAPWLWRRRHPLPAALREPEQSARRRIWIAGFGVATLLTSVIVIGHWISEGEATVDGPILATWLTTGAVLLKVLYDGLSGFWKAISSFAHSPDDLAAVGGLQPVKRRLGRILPRVFGPAGRLVVIVDDLDRCPPAVALDLCTASCQLLSLPNTVVILLGDLQVLVDEASKRFPGSSPGDLGQGQDFLQEIVQFEVSLPRPSESMLRDLVDPNQLLDIPTGAIPRGEHAPNARWRTMAKTLWADKSEGRPLLYQFGRAVAARTVLVGFVAAALIYFTVQADTTIGDSLNLEKDNPLGDIPIFGLVPAAVVLFIVRSITTGGTAESLFEWFSERTTLAEHWNDFTSYFEKRVVDHVKRVYSDPEHLEKHKRDAVRVSETAYAELPPGLKASTTLFRVREYVDRLVIGELVTRVFGGPLPTEGSIATIAQAVTSTLPPNPRLRKRMVNQVMLQFLVADRRGLLRENSPVDENRLAKWVVLTTLWPEEMAREIKSRTGSDPVVINVTESSDFRRLVDAPPSLDGVWDCLDQMGGLESRVG
jgi:hypothetical protein